MKLRINASDKSTGKKQDNAIAKAYRNKFVIPFDFEMLDSSIPYYEVRLGNRLCYELTFSDFNQVMKSVAASPDKITDISLK